MRFTTWLHSLMYRFLFDVPEYSGDVDALVFFVFWKHAAFFGLTKDKSLPGIYF